MNAKLCCPICCEEFGFTDSKTPRFLKECGHTLCSACIFQMLMKGPKISCPTCRIETRGKHLSNYLKNFALIEFLGGSNLVNQQVTLSEQEMNRDKQQELEEVVDIEERKKREEDAKKREMKRQMESLLGELQKKKDDLVGLKLVMEQKQKALTSSLDEGQRGLKELEGLIQEGFASFEREGQKQIEMKGNKQGEEGPLMIRKKELERIKLEKESMTKELMKAAEEQERMVVELERQRQEMVDQLEQLKAEKEKLLK